MLDACRYYLDVAPIAQLLKKSSWLLNLIGDGALPTACDWSWCCCPHTGNGGRSLIQPILATRGSQSWKRCPFFRSKWLISATKLGVQLNNEWRLWPRSVLSAVIHKLTTNRYGRTCLGHLALFGQVNSHLSMHNITALFETHGQLTAICQITQVHNAQSYKQHLLVVP